MTDKPPISKTNPAQAGQAKPAETSASSPPKVMGKRELVDRVVAASGIKKRAAKPVIEALLKELGDGFSRGETLNLQPFGKGIVKTLKTLENAEVIEVRLRRSKLFLASAASGEDDDADPLADTAEER